MTLSSLVGAIVMVSVAGALVPAQAASPQQRRTVESTPVPECITLDNFEKGIYQGWSMRGDCWGNNPEGRTFGGARFSGWSGAYYLSSAHPRIGDTKLVSGTGEARSPEFRITHRELRFKIGGGNYPGQCALNLLVKDNEGVEQVVRTQTGNDTNRLEDAHWDLTDLVGKRARLQIVDTLAFGSNAYIMLDDVALVGLASDAVSPASEGGTHGNPTASGEPVRTGPLMRIEGKLPARPLPTIPVGTSGSFLLPDGTRISGRSLHLEATGYGPGENGPWGDRTALGTKVGYGTVAVDPKIIPLRSRLWVEGYGFCTALDTGGAIKGMRIDLGHDDDVTANQYGRKRVKVIVLD